MFWLSLLAACLAREIVILHQLEEHSGLLRDFSAFVTESGNAIQVVHTTTAEEIGALCKNEENNIFMIVVNGKKNFDLVQDPANTARTRHFITFAGSAYECYEASLALPPNTIPDTMRLKFFDFDKDIIMYTRYWYIQEHPETEVKEWFNCG